VFGGADSGHGAGENLRARTVGRSWRVKDDGGEKALPGRGPEPCRLGLGTAPPLLPSGPRGRSGGQRRWGVGGRTSDFLEAPLTLPPLDLIAPQAAGGAVVDVWFLGLSRSAVALDHERRGMDRPGRLSARQNRVPIGPRVRASEARGHARWEERIRRPEGSVPSDSIAMRGLPGAEPRWGRGRPCGPGVTNGGAALGWGGDRLAVQRLRGLSGRSHSFATPAPAGKGGRVHRHLRFTGPIPPPPPRPPIPPAPLKGCPEPDETRSRCHRASPAA